MQESSAKNTSEFFNPRDFVPKLYTALRTGYKPRDLIKDLFAGLTVGVVALPLAIAFAIGAGASPAQGLYTAIFAGFSIALLGGSRCQVSGPTGAFVVIIADVIARYGMDGLILATFMGGAILFVMGLIGLGKLIKFIPYAVTTGFTTGIAVIIFVGQLKDFFGFAIKDLSPDFFGKIAQYAGNATSLSPWILGCSLATLAIMILTRRFSPRLPAAVIAIVVVGVLVWAFKLPVDTIADRYGQIPHGLPRIGMQAISLGRLRELFSPALTIALLAAIESLLSAVVADGMTGDRHSPSAELSAQGIGNMLSALVGGIPATGAIARTATNIKNGARSPISAIVHSLVLLVFVLFLSPLASAIPLACLAAVLIMVAWDMSDLPRFFKMAKAPKSDFIVMLATFALTVVVDLTAAVQVGVLLAVILFLKRMTDTSSLAKASLDQAEIGNPAGDWRAMVAPMLPKGVEVYELSGPLFFGIADMLDQVLFRFDRKPKVFILVMTKAQAIDASGLKALEGLHGRCRRAGVGLILAGLAEQPLAALRKMGLDADLGADNLCAGVGQAIWRANEILNREGE